MSAAVEYPATPRSQAKADRREALLGAAAALFARSGYNGASIEDLGAAVGVSGPAVYRHFSGKQAVLAALLVGVSEHLVAGGQGVVDEAANAGAALGDLVRFHIDFALSNPDIIRVQDRDLDSLADEDRHRVRALQRTYVELWVGVLRRVHPEVSETLLRIRAHATFGLLNSTPHSARASSQVAVRTLLEEMALAALAAPRCGA
ncbi:TetR/AcrR family transcriptional regulator [Cryobacterium psychrophilum]|uniref:TetR/AcrR family transcriptional regulator n=1 Tax=Cryobacterium psychrophilum TaxID=41988 RepID=A0A4Y8KUX9_9MICO|nr:TetR family transcriptional regulator [Cryobacterium psychrophilum]TDW29049.1 TetR family transcriptional regulator [Cryobacterium psychrophilum]TFD79738.1 TetR/AcrR family transcriptional regulator [Cryobacterium psychrophilum]